LRDRKSRLILAIKNTSRHAKSTADILIKYMKQKMTTTIKTLTLDNGTEFAAYGLLSQSLGAKVFF
ncbi:MAG: IS30 family transposase, partial [Cellvibrionaceae bacterium]